MINLANHLLNDLNIKAMDKDDINDELENTELESVNEAEDSRHPHLYPLSDLREYEVAENDPDVRGWEVIGEDGQKIGEVDELIVDPDLLKVRYLDIVAEDELSVDEKEHHLLIPIDSAIINEDDDNVLLRKVTRESIKGLPAFRRENLTPEYEERILGLFANNDPGTGVPSPGTDYSGPNVSAEIPDEHQTIPSPGANQARNMIRRKDGF